MEVKVYELGKQFGCMVGAKTSSDLMVQFLGVYPELEKRHHPNDVYCHRTWVNCYKSVFLSLFCIIPLVVLDIFSLITSYEILIPQIYQIFVYIVYMYSYVFYMERVRFFTPQN